MLLHFAKSVVLQRENGMSDVANVEILKTQQLEIENIFVQGGDEKIAFASIESDTSTPNISVETAGDIIAFCGDIETTGGIAFQSNFETVTSEVETVSQPTDIFKS